MRNVKVSYQLLLQRIINIERIGLGRTNITEDDLCSFMRGAFAVEFRDFPGANIHLVIGMILISRINQPHISRHFFSIVCRYQHPGGIFFFGKRRAAY